MTTLPLLFKANDQSEHQFNDELRRREQDNFVRFLKISQYLEYGAALIYVASIASLSGWREPLTWFGAFSALALIRVFAIATFGPDIKNAEWKNYLIIGANACCGICWGVSAFYLADGNSGEALLITTMWLSGLMISALGMAAVSSKSPVFWGSPILACLLIKLFSSQDRLFVYAGFGVILLAVFFAAIVYLTRQTIKRDFLREMQNASLANRLTKANDYAERLNIDLRLEIKRRESLEEKLIEERDQAKRLSSIDSLTGINNRRAFDTAIEEEILRARRNRHPLSLIFIDVDHFKEFNDARGHQAGDDVLRRVANVIENSTRRETDLSSRYGGEEFAVLLPNTELTYASRIAENIRQEMIAEGIVHPKSDVSEYVTVSLGVSSVVPETDNAAIKLLSAADQALYSAKYAGRNRTTKASP